MELRHSDEHPHQPGDAPDWAESWMCDFASLQGELRGLMRLTFLPNRMVARYLAWLLAPGHGPVVVLDDEVPIPYSRSLEIRSEGLWADYVVEAAFDHVSVGLEAFGLEVDHDEPVSADMRGERVPLGFDLGWETDGPVEAVLTNDGYAMACVVVGEVMVDDEHIALDGRGSRRHVWGGVDPLTRSCDGLLVNPRQ